MAIVKFEVQNATLIGDHGDIDGVIVVCDKCGHEVEVFGNSEASIKRGAAMLNEECPNGENNFYKEM